MTVKLQRRFQTRGLARRQQLVEAAAELLCREDFEKITFAAIAAKAGVPEGSAYHFFSNRLAVFREVELQSGKEFQQAIWGCKPDASTQWTDLLIDQLNRCLDVYVLNPGYQKLLVTMSIQPETYTIEHEGNRNLAEDWAENLRSHFLVPDTIPLAEKLRLMIECVDALLRLSLLDFGEITDECKIECQRLALAYLTLYVPQYIDPVAHQAPLSGDKNHSRG
ncbi:MAG: TetR/AcrR family transcriptional regulator [Halioglobus sp.]